MVSLPIDFHGHEEELEVNPIPGGNRTVRVRRPLKQMPFPASSEVEVAPTGSGDTGRRIMLARRVQLDPTRRSEVGELPASIALADIDSRDRAGRPKQATPRRGAHGVVPHTVIGDVGDFERCEAILGGTSAGGLAGT